MFKSKQKNDALSDELGTKDRDKQAEIVRRLKSPVVSLLIQYDDRMTRVTGIAAVGSQSNYDDLLAILDLARDQVRAQQMADAQKENGK